MTHEQRHSKISILEISSLLSVISKVSVWLLLGFILYSLRSFFLLVFLTFVFAYIQASAMKKLEPYMKTRILRLSVVFILLLFTISSTALFIVPNVKDQAETFTRKLPEYVKSLDQGIYDVKSKYPALAPIFETGPDTSSGQLQDSPTLKIIIRAFESNDHSSSAMIGGAQNIVKIILASFSAFFLSLLFSFLIVWDLENLKKGVANLKNTKLGFIYDQVSNSIYSFGTTLGRAMEAQLVIALLNTILTFVGLWLMGIHEKGAFLSLIVFICSFIPVAGVFISSIPICLVALQENGLTLALIAAIYITVIHMIEAYILNPKIYGKHLHMNPVIVLIILTVGGKLFGFWGLILGVPLCNYIFGQAIKINKTENPEKLVS